MQNAKKVRTLPFTNTHSILQAFLLNLPRVVASPLVPCDIFFSRSSSAIGSSAYRSNVSSSSHVFILLVSWTPSIASTSTLSNSSWLLSSAFCVLSVSDKFLPWSYLELIFSFLPVNLTIFFLPRTDFTEGQVSAQT